MAWGQRKRLTNETSRFREWLLKFESVFRQVPKVKSAMLVMEWVEEAPGTVKVENGMQRERERENIN